MNMHPVTTQPGTGPGPGSGAAWMPTPSGYVVGCPPGLEYLTQLDQVLCHQVLSLLETFVGWETNNKYAIKNSMGQQIYYAFEETNLCCRLALGPSRKFTLHIVDHLNHEVMRIHRPFSCLGGCCWCANSCGYTATVEAPPGQVIGIVKETTSALRIMLNICSADGTPQLKIRGPICACACCRDVKFPVLSLDETHEVGEITKQWGGFVKEAFTIADNFGISFPQDLDVKTKATLIAALFLIDFMAFEDQHRQSHTVSS